MVITEPAPAAAKQVHPHPIRWDATQQLWVCSTGCSFTRPKREAEVVPTLEEALEEARLAGTGVGYHDLKPRGAATGPEPPGGTQPSAAADA